MRREKIFGFALAAVFCCGGLTAASQQEVKDDATRLQLIKPAAEGELVLSPTFVCCGLEFGASKAIDGLKVEYRRKGNRAAWSAIAGEDFVHLPRTRDYRVSLRDLNEDTDYEVRLVDGSGRVVKTGQGRTWKSDVPVARTIELDAKGPFPKVISDVGSPGGWIRYTTKPGTVLDFGEGAEDCVNVTGAKYVLFDDLTIKGSFGRHVFNVCDSSYVRFRNCNISRWGRVGKPRFDMKGRLFDPTKEAKGYGINFDGAIEIGKGAFGVVVERCFIHDPRGRANSWYYSHPAGPEAVTVMRPKGSTVIRWNDFVGSDEHRFNDAVESGGNFSEDGGFNRDADVYGNFMAICNDDCIEMDGGQRNVRNFDNRYETALCGVSVQGCMVSPSYCYRNVFYGMCDEFGLTGQTLKTGGGAHGPDSRFYLEDNLFWGKGSGITMMEALTSICRRNRFCDQQSIRQKACSPRSTDENNAFGCAIAEERLDGSVPVRPLPFVLDRARYSGFKVAKGVASPQAITVMAKGGDRPCAFRIEKNDDFDWIEVSPARGVVPTKGTLAFTVKVRPERMTNRRNYRGAFLVRTADGLSRPFSLSVETDFVPPYHAEKPGEFAQYFPDGGREGTFETLTRQARTFEFDVPKDGQYYLMVHGKGRTRLKISVDGSEPALSKQQGYADYPTWTMLAPGRDFGNMSCPYDFKAGRHVLKMSAAQGPFPFDGIVLTDSPGSFEPR
jgi:hypothetical protein